jgi:hypothetical protein
LTLVNRLSEFPIRETLASHAFHGKRRTFAIVDAKGAVIISEIGIPPKNGANARKAARVH